MFYSSNNPTPINIQGACHNGSSEGHFPATTKADLLPIGHAKPIGTGIIPFYPTRTLNHMKNLPHHLAAFATVLWVGSLWAIGYLAVPILFHGQADRQLAGMLAGQMFTTLGYLGMLCGTLLLTLRLATAGKMAIRQQIFWVIAVMLLLTLLSQFGFQPMMTELKIQALPQEVSQSPLAGEFRMWHGISSIAYLLQSMLGVLLVIKKP